MMKDYILGDPYYQYEKLSDKDTILIVACDGVRQVERFLILILKSFGTSAKTKPPSTSCSVFLMPIATS